MIPITKTFLPPQEDYQHILKRAWAKGWITNRGELVLCLPLYEGLSSKDLDLVVNLIKKVLC